MGRCSAWRQSNPAAGLSEVGYKFLLPAGSGCHPGPVGEGAAGPGPLVDGEVDGEAAGRRIDAAHRVGADRIAGVVVGGQPARVPLARGQFDRVVESQVDPAAVAVGEEQLDALVQSVGAEDVEVLPGELQTPEVRAFDAVTAQTHDHFSKLAIHAARLQNLSESFSIYASIHGQVASRNLDVSEKMELGGMYAVRAYPEGEAKLFVKDAAE